MDELNMDCSDVELFYNKLRPCPFCGGEATLMLNNFTGKYYIDNHCKIDCPLFIRCGFDTPDYAVTIWNKRITDPRPEGE